MTSVNEHDFFLSCEESSNKIYNIAYWFSLMELEIVTNQAKVFKGMFIPTTRSQEKTKCAICSFMAGKMKGSIVVCTPSTPTSTQMSNAQQLITQLINAVKSGCLEHVFTDTSIEMTHWRTIMHAFFSSMSTYYLRLSDLSARPSEQDQIKSAFRLACCMADTPLKAPLMEIGVSPTIWAIYEHNNLIMIDGQQYVLNKEEFVNCLKSASAMVDIQNTEQVETQSSDSSHASSNGNIIRIFMAGKVTPKSTPNNSPVKPASDPSKRVRMES